MFSAGEASSKLCHDRRPRRSELIHRTCVPSLSRGRLSPVQRVGGPRHRPCCQLGAGDDTPHGGIRSPSALHGLTSHTGIKSCFRSRSQGKNLILFRFCRNSCCSSGRAATRRSRLAPSGAPAPYGVCPATNSGKFRKTEAAEKTPREIIGGAGEPSPPPDVPRGGLGGRGGRAGAVQRPRGRRSYSRPCSSGCGGWSSAPTPATGRGRGDRRGRKALGQADPPGAGRP